MGHKSDPFSTLRTQRVSGRDEGLWEQINSGEGQLDKVAFFFFLSCVRLHVRMGTGEGLTVDDNHPLTCCMSTAPYGDFGNASGCHLIGGWVGKGSPLTFGGQDPRMQSLQETVQRKALSGPKRHALPF